MTDKNNEKIIEAVVKRKRFTEAEESLIRSTFQDESLLVLVRKILLQGKLSASELSNIGIIKNPEVLAVLKKTLNPSFEKGADAFSTIDVYKEADLRATPADHSALIIKSLHLVKKYLDERFAELAGEKVKNPIMFDSLTEPKDDDKEAYICFVARGTLLKELEQNLFGLLWSKAISEPETLEQAKERIRKNSTK